MFGMARNWNENNVRNGRPQIPDYVRNGRFGKSEEYGKYGEYGIYKNCGIYKDCGIYSNQ